MDGKFDGNVIADGVGEKKFVAALLGRKVVAVKRLGKYMWLELSGSGPHIVFHCGMTGAFSVEGVKPLHFMDFKVDHTFPPRFTKLLLEFGTGGAVKRLAFSDPRRFARIMLRVTPHSQLPLSKLAPDPLVNAPSVDALCSKLGRAAAPLKSLLLDQSKLVCGVGNWIADDVLHHARIHPTAVAKTLTRNQVEALSAAIRHIITKAVSVDADGSRFPKAWLFHSRWGSGHKVDTIKAKDGRVLGICEIGGRTTVFDSSKQHMGELDGKPLKPRAGKKKTVKSTTANSKTKTSRKPSAKVSPKNPQAQKTTSVIARKRPASSISK